MDGKARRGVESADGVLGDERIHVNLTIRRQVWTLARQRFPNVSRLVERLLEVALGLESSFEIVRIGGGGAGVAELGQRRWTQDPLPQGFEGSNPSPRTIDLLFWTYSKKLNTPLENVRRW